MTTPQSEASERFRILQGQGLPPCKVKSVPMEDVIPYEKRAIQNHSQSIRRLNERGGLSPLELRVLVEDKSIWKSGYTEEMCARWLEEKYPPAKDDE